MVNIKELQVDSQRLILHPITLENAPFIKELLNTSGWLKYIGNRNIHSVKEAEIFIQNAIDDANAALWIVSRKDLAKTPIGMVTFINRAYLLYPDIGYALMPNATKIGFAYEAVKAMMASIQKLNLYPKINAITLPENERSVNLLTKLNFTFEKEIEVKDELLHLYEFAL